MRQQKENILGMFKLLLSTVYCCKLCCVIQFCVWVFSDFEFVIVAFSDSYIFELFSLKLIKKNNPQITSRLLQMNTTPYVKIKSKNSDQF